MNLVRLAVTSTSGNFLILSVVTEVGDYVVAAGARAVGPVQ